MARPKDRTVTAPPTGRIVRVLRRQGVRKGIFGGSRGWAAVAVGTWGYTTLKKWAAVRGGSLTWAEGPDGCRATLTIDYERRLDPALWFGPVTDAFMDAGAAAFLAGLD